MSWQPWRSQEPGSLTITHSQSLLSRQAHQLESSRPELQKIILLQLLHHSPTLKQAVKVLHWQKSKSKARSWVLEGMLTQRKPRRVITVALGQKWHKSPHKDKLSHNCLHQSSWIFRTLKKCWTSRFFGKFIIKSGLESVRIFCYTTLTSCQFYKFIGGNANIYSCLWDVIVYVDLYLRVIFTICLDM